MRCILLLLVAFLVVVSGNGGAPTGPSLCPQDAICTEYVSQDDAIAILDYEGSVIGCLFGQVRAPIGTACANECGDANEVVCECVAEDFIRSRFKEKKEGTVVGLVLMTLFWLFAAGMVVSLIYIRCVLNKDDPSWIFFGFFFLVITVGYGFVLDGYVNAPGYEGEYFSDCGQPAEI